ncbi:MAG: putative transcriptional regulator, AsnC family [Firmicutes bacterium]|nr:putative transcriptional regulator, AsnC family [Bacillota bacterium]
MLDELDKKIIAAMQKELALVSQPYREIADAVGISQDELLSRLEKYWHSGQIRRMGAVLRHRKVGYTANALCVWQVPEIQIRRVAAQVISYPLVSHCYARVAHTEWPYNFYTMIHGHTRDECRALADKIALETGLEDYVMLYSTREWKKTSMRYFGG